MKLVTISYAAGFYGRTFESFMEDLTKLNARRGQIIPDQYPNLYSDFTPDRLMELRSIAERFEIDLSVHNIFYDVNPLSLVPAVAEFALDTTKRVAEMAYKIGCRTMTVHPGYIFPGWAADPKQRSRFEEEVAPKLIRLAAAVNDAGLECRYENGSYYLSSLTSERKTAFHYGIAVEEMVLVAGASESAFVCLDLGKVVASGLAVSSFVETLGPKIREVQFSSVASIREFIASCEIASLEWSGIDYVYEGRNLPTLADALVRDPELARLGFSIG